MPPAFLRMYLNGRLPWICLSLPCTKLNLFFLRERGAQFVGFSPYIHTWTWRRSNIVSYFLGEAVRDEDGGRSLLLRNGKGSVL